MARTAKKRAKRREWTKEDLRELKAHSRSKTSEPIREVWIHNEGFAAIRLSIMRIMARRTNAETVVA